MVNSPHRLIHLQGLSMKIQQYGNQLKVIMDDGTTKLCYPTQGGLWYCGGSNSGPTPTGDIAWPFDPNVITSGYGPRTGGVGTFHEGVDFSGGKAVLGADILCAADGTVSFSGTNSGFGNYVLVYHGLLDGFDFYTNYGHMDSRAVNAGDSVPQGTKLGTLGATGTITGPCLHWETHKVTPGGSVVWNTNDTSSPVRTAVDPVQFMADYGSSVILNA